METVWEFPPSSWQCQEGWPVLLSAHEIERISVLCGHVWAGVCGKTHSVSHVARDTALAGCLPCRVCSSHHVPHLGMHTEEPSLAFGRQTLWKPLFVRQRSPLSQVGGGMRARKRGRQGPQPQGPWQSAWEYLGHSWGRVGRNPKAGGQAQSWGHAKNRSSPPIPTCTRSGSLHADSWACRLQDLSRW